MTGSVAGQVTGAQTTGVRGVAGVDTMLAVIVFDQLNDVVYLRCDHKFVRHVRSLAVSQGLVAEDEVDPDQVPHTSHDKECSLMHVYLLIYGENPIQRIASLSRIRKYVV